MELLSDDLHVHSPGAGVITVQYPRCGVCLDHHGVGNCGPRDVDPSNTCGRVSVDAILLCHGVGIIGVWVVATYVPLQPNGRIHICQVRCILRDMCSLVELFTIHAVRVLGWFFMRVGGWGRGSVGAMIFAGLIVIDTWRLIEYAPLLVDDYVLCVLDLELDVFNLFLFVLRLMRRGGPD